MEISERMAASDMNTSDFSGDKNDANCSIRIANCSMRCMVYESLYELCGMRYAVCTMRYALCGMRYSLCGMHYAVCNMRYATRTCSSGESLVEPNMVGGHSSKIPSTVLSSAPISPAIKRWSCMDTQIYST